MDWLFAGDLLNQCIGSSFAARGQDIPFFGLYGACSTMGEGLALASMTLDGGFGEWAAVVVSSHFCTAERQYRTPLEYGGQRTPTAQWTVTGAGAAILAREGPGPYVTHCTLGKITDKGITDTNNMGAAMAPAAYATLTAHFQDTGRGPDYYDLIVTGDLGKLGRELLLELMLLADVGMLGMPNAGKSTFIRAVSAAKPKVADYPFTTLVPSLGVVRMDNEKSFVVADIPGLIEGAAEGAGLGIRFLKHLERCRVLLHLIDIDPIDGTDPVENARIIISELEKYSQDLAAKPRWLVFNKIDLLDKVEAEEKAKAIAEALGWEDKYYLISAASGLGVKDLCWDVMTFIIENPVVQAEEAKQPEKVEFMWDDYHRQQLEEIAEEDDEDWDDDWDEDDEEGVEFIYKR